MDLKSCVGGRFQKPCR